MITKPLLPTFLGFVSPSSIWSSELSKQHYFCLKFFPLAFLNSSIAYEQKKCQKGRQKTLFGQTTIFIESTAYTTFYQFFLRDQQEMAPEKRKRRSKTSSWFINCTINSQKLRGAWPTIRGSRRQAGSSAEADAWLRKRGRPGRLPGARVER